MTCDKEQKKNNIKNNKKKEIDENYKKRHDFCH